MAARKRADAIAKVYVAAEGSQISDRDAARIGPELERLADDGKLSPESLLAMARNPKSLFHPFFEWNDQVAAEQRRLDQARHLIRSVRVVVKSGGEEFQVRGIFRVRGEDGTAYVSAGKVLADQSLLEVVVEEAKRDLLQFQKKYQNLSKLASFGAVFKSIEEVLGKSA